jgi:protein-tyrosine-phosphatase
MSGKTFNVLFLCTGNSARSIMAECLMRRWGQNRFQAFSAGSRPRGKVHPLTLELLQRMHHPIDGLRSKDWAEFAQPDSPPLDFVFTVCDQARGEACPAWPGQPMTAHWGVEDPAAFEGGDDERRRLFKRVYCELDNRIKVFSNLRLQGLDRLSLQKHLNQIGAIGLAEGEFPPDAMRPSQGES